MLTRYSILILLFSCHMLYAQVVTVSGESQIEVSKDLSQTQTEKKAEQLAIINALEKAFGRIVFQGNSTLITNVQSGKEVETTSAFSMIGNTYVKGECLEVLKVDFEELEGRKLIDGKKTSYKELKCTVKIKAREIKTPPIEFNAAALSREDKNYSSTTFINDQPVFFYFNTPVDGYLNIFLDDSKNTYRLYPYKDMPSEYQGGVKVIADKDYILFSTKQEFNYYDKQYIVGGNYTMFTDKIQELNRLFVVFSKEPLNKPHFSKKIKEEELSQEELDKDIDIPDGLVSEDFQRWLQRNRYTRDDIQMKLIDITIKR